MFTAAHVPGYGYSDLLVFSELCELKSAVNPVYLGLASKDL